MRALWATMVVGSALLAACDTGAAVGGRPTTPAAPPGDDGPPKSSEVSPPPPLPAASQAPILPPTAGLAGPAPGPATPATYQRPDVAREPTGEALEPSAPTRPPSIVWRRVDVALFSVEMPMPIHVNEVREDGGRIVTADLGPLFLSAGETSTPLGAEASTDTFLRTLAGQEAGSVTKREAVRDGPVVRTSIVFSHLSGAVTRVEIVHAGTKAEGYWLLWRKVRDATGRIERPETDRFFRSTQVVPQGTPAKKRLRPRRTGRSREAAEWRSPPAAYY